MGEVALGDRSQLAFRFHQCGMVQGGATVSAVASVELSVVQELF